MTCTASLKSSYACYTMYCFSNLCIVFVLFSKRENIPKPRGFNIITQSILDFKALALYECEWMLGDGRRGRWHRLSATFPSLSSFTHLF